jgi:signal transduction histidine kinase
MCNREPSREAAKDYSPEPALSLSKGRKPWVRAGKRSSPERAKEIAPRNLSLLRDKSIAVRMEYAVDRPIVIIISDEQEFSLAITARWLVERNVPALSVKGSDSCNQIQKESFDLAIVGGFQPELLAPVLESLRATRKPVIHVSRLNGHSPKLPGVVSLPEIFAWPELLITVATQILERNRAGTDLSRVLEANSQLEHQAALGRYMLEVRHNLNNALTSVLGNSELMLLDPESLSSTLRPQVETIRNMTMRMNEIMQRFSSLQKEMQLVEEQSWKKNAKSAASGI